MTITLTLEELDEYVRKVKAVTDRAIVVAVEFGSKLDDIDFHTTSEAERTRNLRQKLEKEAVEFPEWRDHLLK